MIEYTTKTEDSIVFACFTQEGLNLEVPMTGIAEEEIQAFLALELDKAKDTIAQDEFLAEEENQDKGFWWNDFENKVDWE
jgi:hypothetical protein